MNLKELKEKIKISDLIIDENINYVKREKSIMINCLYHEDRTPSMIITDSLGKFYCFGCGESGDIMNIMEKLYGELSFKERMNYLENNFIINGTDGTNIINSSNLNRDEKIEKDDMYYEILNYISDFYQENLDIKIIDKYLIGQYGFNKKSILDFKIGYSPNSKKLYNNIIERFGYKVKERYKISGKLLGIFLGNGLPIFKNRIIFPIIVNGKVEMFVSRQTKDTPINKYDFSKYLFSSGTKDYLFNEDILDSEYIFITEGVTDCISLVEHGYSAVAIMGVSFKQSILDRLKEKLESKMIYIIFDSDKNKSGENGAEKLSKKLNELGINNTVIKIPLTNGKDKIDVNEYFKNNNKKDFEKLLGEQIM